MNNQEEKIEKVVVKTKEAGEVTYIDVDWVSETPSGMFVMSNYAGLTTVIPQRELVYVQVTYQQGEQVLQ